LRSLLAMSAMNALTAWALIPPSLVKLRPACRIAAHALVRLPHPRSCSCQTAPVQPEGQALQAHWHKLKAPTWAHNRAVELMLQPLTADRARVLESAHRQCSPAALTMFTMMQGSRRLTQQDPCAGCRFRPGLQQPPISAQWRGEHAGTCVCLAIVAAAALQPRLSGAQRMRLAHAGQPAQLLAPPSFPPTASLPPSRRGHSACPATTHGPTHPPSLLLGLGGGRWRRRPPSFAFVVRRHAAQAALANRNCTWGTDTLPEVA
jgi:hypothetical protein